MGLIFERLSTHPPTHPPTHKLADTGRSYIKKNEQNLLSALNLPFAE